MTRDPQLPSTESTDEQHATTSPAHSRRGFLKKAASVGILGMTVATEAASASTAATTASESASVTETESFSELKAQEQRNVVRLWGVAPYTEYTLYTTGHVYEDKEETDSIKYNAKGYPLDDRTYYYRIDGNILEDNVDTYRFYGYVNVISNDGINSDVADF